MQLISANEAAALIPDDATVILSGFGAYAVPDQVEAAIAQRYASEGHPANLTVLCGIGTGDMSEDPKGIDRMAAPGLIGTLVAAHYLNPRTLRANIQKNLISSYTIPLGVMMQLFRAGANHQPGVLTKIGMGTYVDPRNDGPAANDAARAQNLELVSVENVRGQEYLFYQVPSAGYAVIRGSYADEDGNISVTEEAVTDYQLEAAVAVHNNGGVVIAQVKGVVPAGSIPARQVRVHHRLVDYVVVSESDELHMQSYANVFRPEAAGLERVPTEKIESMPLTTRKVCARRAAMELGRGSVVNLGIGMPSGVGVVANEEGLADNMTLTLETGAIGGVPLEGLGFGGAANPEMIMSTPEILDFYDGGGLDIAVLGLAEVDQEGNVNVSKFNGRCMGPGGFIDITAATHKVCFIGSFVAGKPQVEIEEGRVVIKQDTDVRKFVKKVQQITFSAKMAHENGQSVYYITERAVFRLGEDGVELIELAPGVDLERDVLEKMDFEPIVSPDLKEMDSRLFREAKMGIAEEILSKK